MRKDRRALIFCVDVHMELTLFPPSACIDLSLAPPRGRHKWKAPKGKLGKSDQIPDGTFDKSGQITE